MGRLLKNDRFIKIPPGGELRVQLLPLTWYKNHHSRHKPILMHCGRTLMLLRKFKDTTQQELAKKLATTQQYVSELEKQDHFNRAKLDKILKALNSNADEWNQFRRLPPPI